MNLKKIIGLGLCGFGSVFAQEIANTVEQQPETAAATEAIASDAQAATDSVTAPAGVAEPAAAAAPVAANDVATNEVVPAEEPAPTPIAVPAAPVAQEQTAWFAEAAKPEPQKAAAQTAPVPEAATPAAVEEPAPVKKNPFNVLHGRAYNTVGNEAAADNINGLLARPDNFAGRQFFYIEPADKFGVFSVGSIFGALDISGDLGRGTIGYAKPGFGFSIHGSLGQFYFDGDEGKKHSTEEGDDIGLNLSKVLGNYVVTLNADWKTFKSEVGVDPAFGSSSDENYRDLTVTIGLSNAPSAKGTSWSAGITGMRHESNTEVAGKVIDEGADSYVKVEPYFNFGALGLKSEHARFYAGVNASFPVYIFDEYECNMKGKKVDQGLTEFGLVLVPNILGEVALTENTLVFGEAAFDWLAYGYGSGNDENGSEYSLMQSHMNKVTADVGIRYQYQDFAAIELAFGDAVFTDTKSIFNGQGTFVSFGGFILF